MVELFCKDWSVGEERSSWEKQIFEQMKIYKSRAEDRKELLFRVVPSSKEVNWIMSDSN